MATINLGAIKFNWKGAYNSSTSYAVDDVVSSGGNSYVCIQAHSNQAVGNATAYWNIMSSAGTNGTDVGTTLTTQGDILYRDGSGLQRLAKGTAGQVLKINSGATAPEWGTDVGGKILQVQNMITQTNMSSTSSSYVLTALTDTITPSATSSKILVLASGNLNNTNSGSWAYATIFRDGSNISIDNDGFNGAYSAGGDIHVPFNVHYLDSPNSTSSLTYDIRVRCNAGTVRFNHEQNTSSLTLIEIGA